MFCAVGFIIRNLLGNMRGPRAAVKRARGPERNRNRKRDERSLFDNEISFLTPFDLSIGRLLTIIVDEDNIDNSEYIGGVA